MKYLFFLVVIFLGCSSPTSQKCKTFEPAENILATDNNANFFCQSKGYNYAGNYTIKWVGKNSDTFPGYIDRVECCE